jgi:hypothetical protein
MMKRKSSERQASVATAMNAQSYTARDSISELHLFDSSSPTDHSGYAPSPSYTDEMISPVTLRGDMLVW